MAQFYETTIILDLVPPGVESNEPIGVQVLASPPSIGGEPVDYEPLYKDFVEQSPLRAMRLASDPEQLGRLLAVLASSESHRRYQRLGEFASGPKFLTPVLPMEVGTYLLNDAMVAAETSPLDGQSILRLTGEASVVAFLVISGAPAIVIFGGGAGLVVIRGLGAVGGALWSGARDEVSQFGKDAAAMLLDALRRRFGITRRD